ncbi:methylenetetrahydrofolate reductase [Achromobacter xylosoxidans]
MNPFAVHRPRAEPFGLPSSMSLIPRGTPFFPGNITDDCSLEVSVKDIAALTAAASRLPPGSTISIPYLPGQDDDARLAAARAVRGLGLEPMPHLSARRIASLADLEAFVSRAVAEAGVERCFVIAGDPSTPAGPFADSAALIETGVFERAGIKVVGVGAHPDGHPVMSAAQRWEVLERKCRGIGARGMSPLIVTQFGFDADIVLAWLEALRARPRTPRARGRAGTRRYRGAGALCRLVRGRRLRIDVGQVRYLPGQAVWRRGAGRFRGSAGHRTDGRAW